MQVSYECFDFQYFFCSLLNQPTRRFALLIVSASHPFQINPCDLAHVNGSDPGGKVYDGFFP